MLVHIAAPFEKFQYFSKPESSFLHGFSWLVNVKIQRANVGCAVFGLISPFQVAFKMYGGPSAPSCNGLDFLDKRRRKLLYGISCRTELGILKAQIASIRASNIFSFKELANPNVYLCIQCQRLLLKRKQLEEELADVVSKINSKLGVLTEIAPCRKRSLSEASQELTSQEAGGSSSPGVTVRMYSIIYCMYY